LSGYPWLAKLPVLKYLFAQDDKQRSENEIVFAITPHIIRAQDVTEQNLRVVDVGTGNSIGVRHKTAAKSDSPALPQQGSQAKPSRPRPFPPPQPQASADPCPIGQHRTSEEQGAIVCAFD
jgi:general secretion pathway protein D